LDIQRERTGKYHSNGGVTMKTKIFGLGKRGFVFLYVMVIITLFSGVAMTILSRYDSEVKTAVDNAKTASTHYWQDGMLRLARYKFGIYVINQGIVLSETDQKTKMNEYLNEVMPPDQKFDWKRTPNLPFGGYRFDPNATSSP
jgi:hypothetical protein